DSHDFSLNGDFYVPSPPCPEGPWAAMDSHCYTVEAYCNGALVPGYIYGFSGGPRGRLGVSISGGPAAAHCPFSAQGPHFLGGAAKEDWSNLITLAPLRFAFGPPYGPTPTSLSPGNIEVVVATDLGKYGSYRYLDLWGSLSSLWAPNNSTANFTSTVTCDGVT